MAGARSVLARQRLVTLAVVCPLGLAFGGWAIDQQYVNLALVVWVWLAFRSSWLSYSVTRVWLALTGRLPWRLMTFLEDARHRGVLRQAGPVCQFRHALLQERLARTSDWSDH